MATYYIPSVSGWQANGGGVYSSYLRVRVDTSYNVSTNITTATVSLEAYNTTSSWEWTVLSDGTLTGNGATLYTFETPTSARTHHYTSGTDTVFRQITSISNPNSWSFSVQHSDDGAASITVGVNLRLYHYTSSRGYYSYFSDLSGTIYLSEPRASDVSASSGYFGSAIPITVTRKSTAFTHTVQVSCLGRTDTVATGSTASSLSWTPPVATYAPLLTNGMSTTATVYCTTYNGSTAIGTKTAAITVSLQAADVAPSLTLTVVDDTVSPKDSSKTCLQYYGAYVATKSKYKITANPTLQYNATVSTTSITANGATYNSSPVTTGPVASASMTAISGSITDSRQQGASSSLNTTVLAYSTPTVTVRAERCDNNGTLLNTGDHMKVSYSTVVTALNNHNSKVLEIKYKPKVNQSYQTRSVTLSSYSESGSVIIAANVSLSYDVQAVLTDDFGNSIAVTSLPTAATMMNFRQGGTGVGFGKVCETDNAIEVADNWDIKMGSGSDINLGSGGNINLSSSGNIYKNGANIFDLIYPVGSIYMSMNSTSPSTLFGGTWERLKDRFLLAAGTTYAAGATGGEATHTLTVNEMPSHRHGAIYNLVGSGEVFSLYGASTTGDSSPYASTGYAGGGQAHNNMPPYLAVYMWKRTA